jgi:hypothetical protein
LRSWLLCDDRPELQLLALSLLNAVLAMDGAPVLAESNLPLRQLLQSKRAEVAKKVLVTIGLLRRQASNKHCPALDDISDQIEFLSTYDQDSSESLRKCLQFSLLHL